MLFQDLIQDVQKAMAGRGTTNKAAHLKAPLQNLHQAIRDYQGPPQELRDAYSTLCAGYGICPLLDDLDGLYEEAVSRVPAPQSDGLRVEWALCIRDPQKALAVLGPVVVQGLNRDELDRLQKLVRFQLDNGSQIEEWARLEREIREALPFRSF